MSESEDHISKRPFHAYDGDEEYIFVSYAHIDAKYVFPVIYRFHEQGYPIWYDQGLTPGHEWDDEVADSLIKSSLLVVFVSQNSMASSNVQDEIKLALKRQIPIVPIFLEKTALPSGLELRLSNKQSIFKFSMSDDEFYYQCYKSFNNFEIPTSKGFSDEKSVDVWYTLIKNVSRKKGFKTGMVNFKNNETINVEPNNLFVQNLKVSRN